MNLPQRISWLSIIERFEQQARDGISAVEFVKGLNAVVFVWCSPSALIHFLNYVGYYRIHGLDAHLYYAREKALDHEEALIRIYHRLDYQDGNEKVDTGLLWE